ncbi:MAG TPA: hypothetical protein VHW90_14230 [Stellaceae bacterium]|jgi:hypothetical protein|nr:hypothetical protein [Stellaceae bacterium]
MPTISGRGITISAGADISIRGNGAEYSWRYDGTKPKGSVATPLNLRTPYGLYGLPNAGQRVGAAALRATLSDDKPVRLTIDGKPADAYNCFNPGYSQTYNLDIQLMAQDSATPAKWFAGHCRSAFFLPGPAPGARP